MFNTTGFLVNGTRWLLMETDSTAASYWLNWRVLLCAIWVSVGMVFAALLIWRYEGHSKNQQNWNQHEAAGCLYEDEVWGTCSRSVHHTWLLSYRVVAFCVLLALLLADGIIHSGRMFYFYTQWTFTLVTVYFGLGSSLSVYGCLRYLEREPETERDCIDMEGEHGSYTPASLWHYTDMASIAESLNHHDESNCRTPATGWGYALQIIFQMCAGAVVLTDFVYWLIIYPLLTPRSYRITFLAACMHSVNAVFLLGDAILNRLRFPFFRVAYFILWTSIFVIFQWIIHAFVSVSWPYAFLDLASPYAPLWYVAIGLLVFPCFGMFSLIFRIKNHYLSKTQGDFLIS